MIRNPRDNSSDFILMTIIFITGHFTSVLERIRSEICFVVSFEDGDTRPLNNTVMHKTTIVNNIPTT